MQPGDFGKECYPRLTSKSTGNKSGERWPVEAQLPIDADDLKRKFVLDYRNDSSLYSDRDIETQSNASIESIEQYLDGVFNKTSLVPSYPPSSSFHPSPLPSRYDDKGNVIPPKVLKRQPTVTRRVYVATHAKLPELLQKPIDGLHKQVREFADDRTSRYRLLRPRVRRPCRRSTESSRVPHDKRKTCSQADNSIPRGKRIAVSRWHRWKPNKDRSGDDHISLLLSSRRGWTSSTR